MTNPEKPYVIVVGTDYSKIADLALGRALELASAQPNGEVHVVNVAHSSTPLPFAPLPAVLTPDQAFSTLAMHTQSKLDEFNDLRPEMPRFVRVVCHLRFELVAEQLAQVAADLDADLLVVGTHGRRGTSRLLLGSVAEATVRLAPCPVLVVRPKAIPKPAPQIEPPCPRCVDERAKSHGKSYWCEQHAERHGQRHTYHQEDRAGSDPNFPLVYRP